MAGQLFRTPALLAGALQIAPGLVPMVGLFILFCCFEVLAPGLIRRRVARQERLPVSR